MPVRSAPPLPRRLPPAVRALLIAVLLAAAGASSGGTIARADTGTVTSFLDLVRTSDVVAVIVVKEAPPEAPAWTIEVQRAYRGTAPGLLTIAPTPADPDFRPGDRWLILTSNLETLDVRAGLIAFEVKADGSLVGPWDVVDTPATLDDLDALLGPAPVPDATSTAVNATTSSSDAADPPLTLRDALPAVAAGFVLAVLAVFLVAAAVAGRRLARAR